MSAFLATRPSACALGALLLMIIGWPSRGNAVQVAGDPPKVVRIAGADWTIEKPLVGHEQKCDGGTAVVFPCRNIDLLSFLPIETFGRKLLSNLWGWTDSLTHREFVLAGMEGSTAFVEVTDPVNPRYLGRLLQQPDGRGSLVHDVRVYRHYAFIVGEGPRRGMQVFDLTQLRDVKNTPMEFQETAQYDRVDFVHTLAVDTLSGFIYAVGNTGGGETCGGGLHMIDVRTPLQPAFAGCYAETLGGSRPGKGYIHESQCVVYHGPDQRYRNRQICLNAAGEGLGIVDVTDKKNPKPIGVASYPNSAFTHQGWLSEDQRYFFLGDEYDEKSLTFDGGNIVVVESGQPTRTLVFDLADLSDPVLVKEYLATTTAVDHNQYVRGRYLYQANYDAGLRILDVADPRDPKEVAYFDTDLYGRGKVFQFSGAWGNYPYFTKSGLIAVASTGDGLFILRHRAVGGTP